MTEHPRDDRELLSVLELQRRECVPQVVETLAGESSSLQRVMEGVSDVRSVKRRPWGVANTKPRSCHPAPAASPSVACRAL